jgi:hypothetical protein
MVLSTIYEALMARLIMANIGVKHVDLYFGQYLTPEDELPFRCPAVLIQFMPIQWIAMGGKKQYADAEIMLHVLSTVIPEVRSSEAPAIRTKGHAHLILLDSIFASFEGHEITGTMGRMTRIGLDPYEGRCQEIIHKMTFRARITDKAAMVVLEKVPASQTVTSQIL